MPCGQSFGCDGRCKVAPFVCPDYVKVEYLGATAMGWVRRTDIGVGVWEKPDGEFYKSSATEYEHEPIFARVKGA